MIPTALAHFARQNLPAYEADDGPFTDEQMRAIDRLQPPGRMKVKSKLF